MDKRGYCGIGIEFAKTEANVGTLWRSAYCLGADFIFTIGHRYQKQSSDTVNAWRHIPLFHYESIPDFKRHIPHDCLVVGIEIANNAVLLDKFTHPERCIYLLGREDGDLSREAQALCQHIVVIESSHCLNVASAGTIVLHHRAMQQRLTD